jgi:hypothetical protein
MNIQVTQQFCVKLSNIEFHFFNYQLNAQLLHFITICMLHYNSRHVSSINMPIFRRTNCIITASGIVTLCKRLYSMPVESGLHPFWSCSKAVYKPVWHIPLLSVQWINSWWWTEELSETCIVSWQNKFVKLVHLIGFITKKFVTTHGHINVKLVVRRLSTQPHTHTHTHTHSLLPTARQK